MPIKFCKAIIIQSNLTKFLILFFKKCIKMTWIQSWISLFYLTKIDYKEMKSKDNFINKHLDCNENFKLLE